MPNEPVSDENRYWSDVPSQNLAWEAQLTERDKPQLFELTKLEKKEYRDAVCKLGDALLPKFFNAGVYKNGVGTELRIRLERKGQLVSVSSKMLDWHPMGWKRQLPVIKTAFMILGYYQISLKSSFVLAEYLYLFLDEVSDQLYDRLIRFNDELDRLDRLRTSDFMPNHFDKVLHPDLIPDLFDKVLLRHWAFGDPGSTRLFRTRLISKAVVEIRQALNNSGELGDPPTDDPDKSTKSDHLGQFTTHNSSLTSLLQEYSRETSLIEDVVLDIIVRRGITSLRDSGDLSQPLILSANKFLKETDVTPVALKPVIDHLLKHGKH